MITFSSKATSSGTVSKPSTTSAADPVGSQSASASPATALPSRIRASSSCPYLPILGGLSGPASPAEVTKQIAGGEFSPRILESSEGGYFALGLRNTAAGSEREQVQLPSSPRRVTSSSSSLVSGPSGTFITRDIARGEILKRDCVREEMVAGIESEGVGTVHHYYHHYYHHDSPEVHLLKLKAKSSSNISSPQIHNQARTSSALSYTYTPGNSSSAFITSSTITSGPHRPSSSSGIQASGAASQVPKTATKPSALRQNSTKTSPKSPLRLTLPPHPKVPIDSLGGVHHIYHPQHRFPNTPDGRTHERRRESAPGLLAPGIRSRAGDWLLTPPEEVGGMVWQCPTPSNVIDVMADRREDVDGEGVEGTKPTRRRIQQEGRIQSIGAAVVRKAEKAKAAVVAVEEVPGVDAPVAIEADSKPLVVDDDEAWSDADVWLKGAAEVMCKSQWISALFMFPYGGEADIL